MEPKLLLAERFCDTKNGCNYRYVMSETEYFRPHYHDYYELFIMQKGTAFHFINGEKHPLKVGDMIFIRPTDVHDYISDGANFSFLNITLTTETVNSLFALLGNDYSLKALLSSAMPPSVSMSNDSFNWLNKRFKSICAISPSNEIKRAIELKILVLRTISKFFSFPNQETDLIPVWLDELVKSMKSKDNFVEGTEKLFSLSDKSREHICRSIKKYYGVTATEYVNNLRLHYIANMLENSNYSITDIIYESGFGNISWASKLFKNKYNVSMLNYRKKHTDN